MAELGILETQTAVLNKLNPRVFSVCIALCGCRRELELRAIMLKCVLVAGPHCYGTAAHHTCLRAYDDRLFEGLTSEQLCAGLLVVQEDFLGLE